MLNTLLIGYYGADNLGDDMMLFCLKKWLNKQDIHLKIVSESPIKTKARFSLESIDNCALLFEWGWFDTYFRGKALRLLLEMSRVDAVIVGGGDLIRDDRGWKIFLYTMEKILLAILLRKKVFLVNVGIGKPITLFGKFLLRYTLNHTSKIIVRDFRSLEICKSLGLSDKLSYLPDIVFNLRNYSDVNVLKNRTIDTPNRILICLRNDPNVFEQYKFGTAEIISFARALDELIINHRVELVFFPFQGGLETNDNIFHRKIISNVLNKNSIKTIEWNCNFNFLLDLFSNAKMVIGMRLHSLVLAKSLGVPIVALPYDKKILEFCNIFSITNIITETHLSNSDSIYNILKSGLSSKVSSFSSFREWDDFELL